MNFLDSMKQGSGFSKTVAEVSGSLDKAIIESRYMVFVCSIPRTIFFFLHSASSQLQKWTSTFEKQCKLDMHILSPNVPLWSIQQELYSLRRKKTEQ